MKTYFYFTEDEGEHSSGQIVRIVFDTLDEPNMYVEVAKNEWTAKPNWKKYKLVPNQEDARQPKARRK